MMLPSWDPSVEASRPVLPVRRQTFGGNPFTSGTHPVGVGGGGGLGGGPGGGPDSSGGGGGQPGEYGPDEARGLSSATIIGIAVGSVVGGFLLLALLVWLCTRGRRRHGQQQREHDEVQAQAKEAAVGVHTPPDPGPLPAATTEAWAAAPRQGERRRRLSEQSNEALAFKVATTEEPPMRAPDNPPAYEESEQQQQGHGRGGGAGTRTEPDPLQHDAMAQFSLRSVPDGFRCYSTQPQPAGPSKLAPGGKADPLGHAGGSFF